MTDFLRFEEIETKGKTRAFKVISAHSNEQLGQICWRCGWRRYVMHFDSDCDWSVECMAQCYKFIQKLMDGSWTEELIKRSEREVIDYGNFGGNINPSKIYGVKK